MSISPQLKEMYSKATNEEKKESWLVYGCSDQHFRNIVNNKNSAGKEFGEDIIMSAFQALKQAKKNVATRMYNEAMKLEVTEPTELKGQ